MEIREKRKVVSKMDKQKRKTVHNNVMKKEQGNKLERGDVLTVHINAVGAKNIGVAELENGYTILVPNTKCGEKVEIQIEKILQSSIENESKNSFGSSSLENQQLDQPFSKGPKYAVGKKVSGSSETDEASKIEKGWDFDFQVGQKFTGTIQKAGPKNSGIISISPKFFFVIPNTKVGEKIVFEIQKIKPTYAIGQNLSTSLEFESFGNATRQKNNGVYNFQNDGRNGKIQLGHQYHMIIPGSAKTISNYFVFKLNGKVIFLQKSLGAQLGDTVKIQIQKATQTFAIAKILKLSPLSVEEQKFIRKQKIQEMIQASMHFGEKAIRCNANMRKYLWYRKKPYGTTSSAFAELQMSPFPSGGKQKTNGSKSAQVTSKPMMKRGRHILNILKTERCFDKALKQLAKYAAKGKTFLFVGTKKPAASLIAKTALLSQTSFFVNTRWLGGMLTNWKTILKSIAQIRPILKQKEKILQKILEKRQKIQRLLFAKVALLRKKSEKFMRKGKYLIRQILTSKTSLIEKSQKLLERKTLIFEANQTFLTVAKNLKTKKFQTLKMLQKFEKATIDVFQQKQQVKKLIRKNLQKFQELNQLFVLGKEIAKRKTSFENNNQKNFIAVASEKLQLPKGANGVFPNPSSDVLKKMILVLSTLQNAKSQSSLQVSSFGGKGTISNRSKAAENNQTIIFTKFLNKFLAFLPILKNEMEKVSQTIVDQEKFFLHLENIFGKLQKEQKQIQEFYKKIVAQLSMVYEKVIGQRKTFEHFHQIFEQFASEQRLLKFLPKLRYLPTSPKKMYETIELFMKKFVDPKLTYPMDQIYDQKLKFTSKKIAATRKQKWQRLEKYFGGITKMQKMNTKQISKNVAIIIGQQEELNAIHECRKLGMKIFAVVDTNCNPKYADYIIPANDDSRNAIKYMLGEMLTYIRLGQKLRKKVALRRGSKKFA